MRISRITLIAIVFLFHKSVSSQDFPKVPTDGQICLVFNILQSQKENVNKYLLNHNETAIDGNCFALSLDYLSKEIFFPEDNELFDKFYFGSTPDKKDSILKINEFVSKYADTVRVDFPGYAYCRCESGIGCFDVKLSPIFRGVFSVEVRVRDYDPWKYKVSERKLIFTFNTEEDGDITGYLRINGLE